MRPSEEFKAWLEQTLPAMAPGERLPTDKQLGAKFDLSEVTVRKIMQTFAKRGALIRVQGKGTFKPGKPESRPVMETSPNTSAENIAQEITRMIQQGRLRKGSVLPQCKFLCYQFHVAPRTVSQAYEILRAQGLVARVGRKYWVGGSVENILYERPRKKVYLFARDYILDEHFMKDDYLYAAFTKMERELAENGYVVIYKTISNLRDLAATWLSGEAPPYGLVFFSVHETELEQILPSLKKLLNAPHVDIQTVLECRTRSLDEVPKKNAHILSFGTLSTILARETARFLTARDYSDAVFVYNHARGFKLGFWGFLKLRAELRAVNSEFPFRLVARCTDGFKAFIEYVDMKIGQRNMTTLSRIYGYESAKAIKAEMYPFASFAELLKLFPEARAWVFSHTEDAVEALQWAKSERVPVPKQLGILTLEDNPDYYHVGISRFEPDLERIGYLLAHSIIGDFTIAKTSKGYLRTSARIVEKLTT